MNDSYRTPHVSGEAVSPESGRTCFLKNKFRSGIVQDQWFYAILLITDYWHGREPDETSISVLAERYFHIFKNGKFLHPGKLRHDKDPGPEVIEFIDGVDRSEIDEWIRQGRLS